MRVFLSVISLVFLVAQTSWAQPGTILEKDQLTSVRYERAMVTAGEDLATQVGSEILKRGGNAVDSAVATAFSLAVTLPRAGNLGGGGFALILDAEGEVQALDFREKAPAALHRDFYLDPKNSSRTGATAAGVPGTVAGLWEMHKRYGVLPWSELIEPARRLAEEGILVTPWMQDGLAARTDRMTKFAATKKAFYPGGKAPQVGSLLKQKDLALTLGRIAKAGPKDFYQGETAKLLVAGVSSSNGVLSVQDLSSYKAKWRQALSTDFRGYRVWSMPPPSSGGVNLLQMLELVEPYELNAKGQNSASHLHLLAEAMRLAYCDRAKFLGDSDFVKVPVERLLSADYLAARAKQIPKTKAGSSQELAPELFRKPKKESPDTTHFNVVDANGMAVSFTYTLNFSYGSGYMAPGTGFLLNNEMDDFNAKPGQPNAYGLLGSAANNVAAGKRPLSSMTPTLITKDGKFFAALGAPGGSRIINGVFQVALNVLAYGFNAQTAVSLPRIHHQWSPDTLFAEIGISSDTESLLETMGHDTKPIYAVAHVLAIVKHPKGYLEGGLDPRRPAFAEGY